MKVDAGVVMNNLPEPAQSASRRGANSGHGADAVVKPAALSQDARRSTPAPEEREVPASDVQVALSPAARILSRTREGITQDEVDKARVARVREQLEQGNYEYDNQALAQAVIEKELRWTRT